MDEAGAGTAGTAVVFDVRTADFEAQVIKRSHEVPVLVDFWAPWCAPCKALGPALEQVVREQGGKVLLAKVNTDEEPALAKGFRITGIPAVKAFHKGRLVNEFVGGRDLRFLKTFIESVLPQRGEAELTEASNLLTGRRFDDAVALLRPLVGGDQALQGELLSGAQVLLAEALIGQGDLAGARALLAAMDPRSLQLERAELLGKLLDFLEAAGPGNDGDGDAAARLAKDSSDGEARYALAAAHARRGAYGDALEQLLELVGTSRSLRDRARQAMTTLFQFLGPEDERTHEYRRRLQVYL
jgi:putative thioredoxin